MDYKGGCNYDNALKRIIQGFKKVCADGDLHVNVTCATDVNQMEQTVNSMQEVVLKKLLAHHSLTIDAFMLSYCITRIL